jgi:2-oxoglutarate ferredoxin oxidoreductase subunit alpha
VLAPVDLSEAVAHVQLAFDLADRWRNPVLLYGDYLLAHTAEAVAIDKLEFPPLPAKEWAADGTLGGSGRSRCVNPIGMEKGKKGVKPEELWRRLQAKHDSIAETEARFESEGCEGAEVVVIAFGTLAKFARYAVRELQATGKRVGYARPITLWPFPSEELASACRGARAVAVLEMNAGQMVDDVRLAILGAAPVVEIGEISTDDSGFGVGGILDADLIRGRIEAVLGAVGSGQKLARYYREGVSA